MLETESQRGRALSRQVLTIGHSPDADDAFMFYALTHDKIDTGAYRFQHLLEDIETLNRRCVKGELEISAVSLHAYAHITERYALLACGASMGKGYGPIVVRRLDSPTDLRGSTIAIPGTLTTAFLTLKLYLKDFQYTVVPFDQILDAVKNKQVDAGLLIHEGQLTYKDEGLQQVVDLGAWWLEETGLPLPLGVNVVRRDLGDAAMREVSRLMRESIDYALAHREEALSYAMQYSRGLDTARGDQFVGMYVNDYTRDFGDEGRQAVDTLLNRAYAEGIIPNKPQVDFV
jgi:1,4-dihydroxy-6-naphthoate synthase